jgi:hypothetical protein
MRRAGLQAQSGNDGDAWNDFHVSVSLKANRSAFRSEGATEMTTETIELTSADLPTELAFRAVDGLEVRLWWLPTTKTLTVSVRDARRDLEFEVAVEEAKPLDVFYHPYAYAHSRGIVVEDVPPEELAA